MYADRSDLVLRYGENEISQLERALTANESVNSYIEDASDIADGYIGVIYDVPLTHPPKNLKIYICDIARFLLWRSKASDQVRQRYEDAIGFLKRVADGKATLLIQNTETQEVTKPKKVRASAPLGTTYTGGVFSNAKLDDMPSL